MNESESICDNCKKPCAWHMEDFGVGATEYGSSVSIDINLQPVSNCCGVPLVGNVNTKQGPENQGLV